ncbi:hypothetical protein MNBD_ALPHA11-962 [hydrothermal vent metagenome]|uniref:Uncharacterized protein n=1 Tax=hydrothermal vent metagenome TaxID=652676 RepID=A0A3B0U5E9_9ZZZZ
MRPAIVADRVLRTGRNRITEFNFAHFYAKSHHRKKKSRHKRKSCHEINSCGSSIQRQIRVLFNNGDGVILWRLQIFDS